MCRLTMGNLVLPHNYLSKSTEASTCLGLYRCLLYSLFCTSGAEEEPSGFKTLRYAPVSESVQVHIPS